MFNNLQVENNNITNNKDTNGNVINQFISPISNNESSPKRDSIKIFLALVLLLVILLSAGSFFYLKILKNEIKQKEDKLLLFDNSESLIQFENNLGDMRNISQRLKLLNSIYDKRIYLSQMMFPVLERLIESSRDSYVYFNKLSLKRQINSNLVSLNISGMALDYPTLYRQTNNFKLGKYSEYIKNFKLNNFNLNEKGTVEFNITLDMDIGITSLLNFLNTVNADLVESDINTVNSGPLYNIPTSINNASTSNNENINSNSSSTYKVDNNIEKSTSSNLLNEVINQENILENNN